MTNNGTEITLRVVELPCPRWNERSFSARIDGGPAGWGSTPWAAVSDAIRADNTDLFGRLDWNRW